MASQKIQTYSFSAKDFLLGHDDLFVAVLTFFSYWLLLLARYVTAVMYNFFWIFLIVISPLLLLFNLFKGTSHITANLFKAMIQVASWKIVWAILGVMLVSLSFGKMYAVEGSYCMTLDPNECRHCSCDADDTVTCEVIGRHRNPTRDLDHWTRNRNGSDSCQRQRADRCKTCSWR